MIPWLKLVPSWAWAGAAGLVLALVVGGAQQVRVYSLQSQLETERSSLLEASEKLGACRATRTMLLGQVIEQNSAIADLSAQATQRQEIAESAQRDARDQSEADYQAANRLQQERTGGDACAAAESVIDGELGL